MTKKSQIHKVDVTQTLTQVNGDPIMESTIRCDGCVEIATKIYELLSPGARLEMESYQGKIDEITKVESKKLPLRFVLNRALLAGLEGDEFNPQEHAERDSLARRIYDNDEPNITIKEKAMLLDRIAKVYNKSSLIAGQACRMLDPAILEPR